MFRYVIDDIDGEGTRYFLLWRAGAKQVSFDVYKDRAATWDTAPFRAKFMKCIWPNMEI